MLSTLRIEPHQHAQSSMTWEWWGFNWPAYCCYAEVERRRIIGLITIG